MSFGRRLLRILIFATCVYAAVCVALYFLQEHLIFAPEKLAAEYRFTFPGKFEEHRIAVDGAVLSALWFRARTAGDAAASTASGTVFYLHGNAGSLRSWGDVAPSFTARGYDAFIIDYRGYGKSTGTLTSEQQLHDDAAAAYAYFTQRSPAQPIYIYGRSLGTGLAVDLASRHAPRALLLEAPYVSLTQLARRHYPWVPSMLLRYRLASDERLPAVRSPVHFFHGENDTTVPAQASFELAALVAGTRTLTIVANGGHNDLRHSKAYNSALDQVLR